MKINLNFKTLGLIAAILLVISCGPQSKEHVEEADENLTEASDNLKDAAKEADAEVKAKATADWQAFKEDADRSIAAMEKQANELKAQIANADNKTKAKINNDLEKLEKKLTAQKAKLDQKNFEFQNDLSNFNETIVAENEEFKKEFTHDMSGLVTAFNDLFTDNVK